jgi:hypothetical protein
MHLACFEAVSLRVVRYSATGSFARRFNSTIVETKRD